MYILHSKEIVRNRKEDNSIEFFKQNCETRESNIYDDLDLNDGMGSIETQTKAYIYGQTTTNAFFQIIYLKYGFQ